MSRAIERFAIAAELAAIEKMLFDLGEKSPIARVSLDERKTDLEAQLRAMPDDGIQRARIELTFRGAPVHLTQGVEASFAANALEKYDKAIALAAASMSQKVKQGGRIPGRDSNKLFVTDRALGSFGFVLEEIPADEALNEAQPELGFENKSLIYKAVEQTEAVLRACNGTDEELVDAASQVDRRTIVAIRDFLEAIRAGDACFNMRCDDQVTGFQDVASVAAAEERLDEKNISEAIVEVDGFLAGYLPGKRCFEIQPLEGGDLIYGKLDPELTDEKIKELNQLLSKQVHYQFLTTRVGRVRFATRYRLVNWTLLG